MGVIREKQQVEIRRAGRRAEQECGSQMGVAGEYRDAASIRGAQCTAGTG